MNEFLHIGPVCLNLRYVKAIFEDADNPGQYIVNLFQPVFNIKDGQPHLLEFLTIGGKEALALRFYLENNVRDVGAEYDSYQESRVQQEQASAQFKSTRKFIQPSGAKPSLADSWDMGL